jgi:DAACS family dicarboxylate/amino acid:cation (Na+ or H+) symporter
MHRSITPFIVGAMVCGMLVGALFGEHMVPLGVIGTLYIQLIKAVAVPLVFVSIVDALVSTSLSLKTASRWLFVIVINTTCALIIGLTLANVLKPGASFLAAGITLPTTAPVGVKEFSFQAFLKSIIPESFVGPFAENNVVAVVLLAIMLGTALRAYCRERPHELSGEEAQRMLTVASGVVNRIVLWLVALVPLAVFCVTAKTVGASGFGVFKGLSLYVLVACLGLFLQMVLVYPWWIVGVGGIALKRFWSLAHRPLAYAFGTNSSLATVPVTLHALDELGVRKSASRLATCIGTNCNNDGILLYEAMAVLFVAQAFGVELSLGEQVFAALVSLAAAIGVAGVPEAGVVSLSLVLGAVGLPLEILPLLLTVDWIVARFRSVTNVMSDMTVSIAVSGLEEE